MVKKEMVFTSFFQIRLKVIEMDEGRNNYQRSIITSV